MAPGSAPLNIRKTRDDRNCGVLIWPHTLTATLAASDKHQDPMWAALTCSDEATPLEQLGPFGVGGNQLQIMSVLILYNQPGVDSQQADQADADVLAQVAWVRRALVELGYRVDELAVTLDLTPLEISLRSRRPEFVVGPAQGHGSLPDDIYWCGHVALEAKLDRHRSEP